VASQGLKKGNIVIPKNSQKRRKSETIYGIGGFLRRDFSA
jgi:hypothetical protein